MSESQGKDVFIAIGDHVIEALNLVPMVHEEVADLTFEAEWNPSPMSLFGSVFDRSEPTPMEIDFGGWWSRKVHRFDAVRTRINPEDGEVTLRMVGPMRIEKLPWRVFIQRRWRALFTK